MTRLSPHPRLCRALALLTTLLAACHAAFVPARYIDNEKLFRDSMREYQRQHWDNAIAGFERLTINLPARDTLFVPSLWYLAKAHQAKKEYLLASQSFTRLSESAPNDSLADDALLEAGRAYARLWRKPQLDPQYGETALSTLRTMLALYPGSSLIPQANAEIDRVLEMFAQKLYLNGMHYYRRKGYEPSIIYFKDVIDKYPTTPTARLAMLKLAEAYSKIHYREELVETCGTLRRSYPSDPDVSKACAAVPVTTATPNPVTTPTTPEP